MTEYEQLGHMSKVERSTLENKSSYFLPHHAVVKETSTTTRTRVVFDGSTKTTNGKSLNDELLLGPFHQRPLFDTLLRFRRFRYGISADIVKMYRMCQVHLDDRAYQRIIWRKDPESPADIYELTTIVYGTRAAPYLATRCLHQLSQDEAEQFPLASKIIERDFYVDDLLTGAHTESEACEIAQQVDMVLKRGGFQLSKWFTNSPTVKNQIENATTQIKCIDHAEVTTLLGIGWNVTNDNFHFKFCEEATAVATTKRQVLSKVARIYDPMGWLGPVIVLAKIFMQQLWKTNLDWDDVLPSSLQDWWTRFERELPLIQEVKIPRFLGTTPWSQIELHGLADASERAYCGAVYIRTLTAGTTRVELVASRTRLAPIKTITVARLELCAALLVTGLLKTVMEALDIPDNQVYAWSDSQIVLAWLRGHPSDWNCFVANRVSKIQQTLPHITWQHIQGTHNSSDVGSRGALPSELMKHELWWRGPTWLSKPGDIPVNSNVTPDISAIPERKQSMFTGVNETLNYTERTFGLLQKFSAWHKVQKATAYVLRFIHNCRNKLQPVQGCLTVSEIQQATYLHIRAIQDEYFHNEIEECNRHQDVSSSSKLKALNPFIDDNGLLRVGGRIQNSAQPFNALHPIILPAKGRLVELLLDAHHKALLHAGPQLMLSTFRQRYWIVHGRNAVKAAYHRCVTCYRFRATTCTQQMAPLPEARVNQARCFQKTSVDFCGPFLLKAYRGRGFVSYKTYVAIFICMASRAIHLELVSGLTSELFLAALRRFFARRGLSTDIFCDNGTNFIGGRNELSKLLAQAVKCFPQIQAELALLLVKFHFNTPLAPSHGGYWEAAVKSMKTHLVKASGSTVWTFEELTTLLTQIEAILNSRPLCALSNEPSELECLTPAHLLTGSSLLLVPEPDLSNTTVNNLKRYQLIQRLQQQFWRNWSNNYLQQLQTRTKWQQREHNLELNDLVILHDKHQPPSRWNLGRIVELHPGKDHLVRVVTVRTSSGCYKRPIQGLIKLPPPKSE